MSYKSRSLVRISFFIFFIGFFIFFTPSNNHVKAEVKFCNKGQFIIYRCVSENTYTELNLFNETRRVLSCPANHECERLSTSLFGFGECGDGGIVCKPLTNPPPSATPTPARSELDKIIARTPTPTPTPRGERITARGTISLRVIPNGIAYDTIDLLVYRPSPGGLHTDRVNDNNSNSYTLSIPNAVWEVDRLYTYSVRITSDNKFVGGSTERFRVSQNPFVLPLTITLSENAEDTTPTNSPTPTPRENNDNQDPTPTPRPIEWCRTDGDQGEGQGCCSNASCQEGLSCTGKPEPGGLRCCPANTFWDGEKCAGATCQTLGFSCVSGSNKAGEVCCSPQFTCSNSVCIESEDYTKLPTPTPNQTITPTPPANACDNFGGQDGCTQWCRTSGGGGPNSYCNSSCGTDGTGCIKPLTGTPIPTVADNCAVFGSHAACNTWCQKPERGAAGCNTGCNGCYY